MGVMIDLSTGLPFAVTLELPWLGNKDFISCIPKGVYRCEPYSSEKHEGTYKVIDVPNRDDILFHVGNNVDDTKGCICPGMFFGEYKEKPAVLNSKVAFDVLKDIVGSEDFDLVIS